MSHYATFVLRILLNDENSVIEGRITHVASQETAYFLELGKAMTFIKDHLSADEHNWRIHLDSSTAQPEGYVRDADHC